ncbi:MAG: 30S ribosomal protein S9 [Candidatus Diapherotrites archaeon]
MTEQVVVVKKKRRKAKGIITKAKKKTAVARAQIKAGKGKITINKMNLKLFTPEYVREFIREPLLLAPEVASQADIEVVVQGGGAMGQAVAARAAIAKALVEYSNDKKLKDKMMRYDRMLLVDDPRRKEAKKPLGRGARKKRQLSYR